MEITKTHNSLISSVIDAVFLASRLPLKQYDMILDVPNRDESGR
jgi:hypothetical protein